MERILESRKRLIVYGVGMLAFAALYSFLFGLQAGMSAICIAGDAVIFFVLCGVLGLMLGYVIRYAVPRDGMPAVKTFLIIMVGLLFVAIVVGAETIAFTSVRNGAAGSFAATIALRCLVVGLIYGVLVLLYGIPEKQEKHDPAYEAQAAPSGEAIERISVRSGKKIKVIPIEEIEYLQAERDYVAVVTADGRWLKEQTMKHFEEHLPADTFVRVHRSYIVNVPRIMRLERYGNLYQIILQGGDKIKVSDSGYRTLRKQLDL